ncbi:hypothetical protein ACFXP3_16820 [Streptomyces sp. NPDC059096]|uniref:hypothetical protein n=1 Tax=Streptomyces sp. NPDC059096 TaxID=3346727 RepID=UPI0036C7FBF3
MTESTAVPASPSAWLPGGLGSRLAASGIPHLRETTLVRMPVHPGRRALGQSAPALVAGRASSSERLALLLAAAPGRPIREMTPPPAQAYEAYRQQGGVFLARLHVWTCPAMFDAANCPVRGPADGDPQVTACGHLSLDGRAGVLA